MEKKMNNKGFSLVELIIVVAIMAVLIGVLAPAYLQYVEKSKKTTDCDAIGKIMTAMENIAADPAITMTSITATVTSGGCTYSDDPDGALNNIVPSSSVSLSGKWSGDSIAVTGTKQTNGSVVFSLSMSDSSEMQKISPKLMKRFGGAAAGGGAADGE